MTAHDGWRVSVLDSAGQVCGAGVLIAPDLVLTCAHVVVAAVPGATARHPPEAPVTVAFPTGTAAGRRTATVPPDGWVPRSGDLTGDLALLRLSEEVDVRPATLATCGPPSRRDVRIFGHAHRDPIGRWATARMTGTAGANGAWVQLNDVNVAGHRIERGYSGAGVVEEETSLVVGLIVGVDKTVVAKGAWMMSMEEAATRLPQLGELLQTRSAEGFAGRTLVQARRDDYQAALVDALADLEGLHTISVRAELIDVLDHRLDSPLGVGAGRSARGDLEAIVSACLDHPGGVALRALTDAIHHLFGDDPQVDRFNLLAAQDPGRRVSGDDLVRLGALLAELPDEDVLDAARVALGPLGQRSLSDVRDRAVLVEVLAGHLGLPGAPPLLVLLKRLAARAPRPESDALAEWLHRLADRWQVPTDAVTVAAEQPPQAEPKRSYLVVQLREDAPTPGGYLLTILLRHDDGTGEPLVMNDDQPLGLQEIPGHLGTHLRRALHGVGPVGELTIEFMLPSELLGHAVDQFEVMLDDGLRRLGEAYPVVVRSADRARRTLMRRRWELRTQWLHENGHEHHPHAIIWVPLPAGIGPSLEHWLRDRDGYSDEHPVCLVFTWRGQPALSRTVPRALQEALDLGLPAMVWCRNARLVDQFVAEMANQLNGLAVSDLVRRVHRLRQAAEGRDSHVGSHVCLLWDDPGRLIEDQGLSAPA